MSLKSSLAVASAGSTVFEPGPWYPVVTPAMLHVGRNSICSITWSGFVERGPRLPQAAVGLELVRVVVRDLLERLGADLLFALDQEAKRHRDLAQPFERLQRVDARHHVRLVVGNASGDDAAVALGGLEGR